MKITFITTVLNEEKTISKLLDSILLQTKLPQEVIITDGGSTDSTVGIVKNFKDEFDKKKISLKILLKKGNRSIGRNYAIKNSSSDIIVCSDAGCTLDKNWIKEITRPFEKENIDIVAGYYKGSSKSVFQKCLIPYVLVMEDQINPEYFRPASRSMAFKKSIWKKTGGFNEKLFHNEDYEFARRLEKIGANRIFMKKAIVYWIPRKNLKEAFIMFFRFALGDIEAGIVRWKVVFLFVRYLLLLILLVVWKITGSSSVFISIFLLTIFYLIWSIAKNYNYIKKWQAFFILPILQVTADTAVLLGSFVGFKKLWVTQNKR